MHEFGVTQAAVEAALERAEQANAASITDVHLVIGTVSSIETDSIRLYWEDIAEDTLAEQAKLHFRCVPTDCYCSECEHAFVVEVDLCPCPRCGGQQVRAVNDEFLALEAIDIESIPTEILHG